MHYGIKPKISLQRVKLVIPLRLLIKKKENNFNAIIFYVFQNDNKKNVIVSKKSIENQVAFNFIGCGKLWLGSKKC